MGAFQGEWHIDLHVSPTTCPYCPISLATVLIYYKDFKTLKITGFGVLAGQIQHMAAQKVGFTPRLIWHVRRNWLGLAPLFLPFNAVLKPSQFRRTYPGSIQKKPDFGP